MALAPWWTRQIARNAARGEQTQPEYDEPADNPPPPPPSAPAPPARGEQTAPAVPTPAPLAEPEATPPWDNIVRLFGDALPSWFPDLSRTPPVQQSGAEDISSVSEEIIRQVLGPLFGEYNITGGFGQTGGAYPSTGHIGLDLVPKGTDWGIRAPLDGEIIENAFSEGYGNYLKIRHADGSVTLYAHLAEPSPLAVGTSVAQGARLGTMGSTGHSTAAHLHFEVYDPSGNRYDPALWLEQNGGFEQTAPPDAPPEGRWSQDDVVQAVRYWSQKLGYGSSFSDFALAIAWGESGWNPYNDIIDINGVPSRGIYQLNGKGRLPGFIERYGEAGISNPYNQAEYNLPYLYAAYKKYGGDEAWQSDPATLLKYGWKYGQVSIWPTDAQVADALQQVAKNAPSTAPLPGPRPTTTTAPSPAFADKPPYNTLQRTPPMSGSLERTPWWDWLSGLTRQSPFGSSPFGSSPLDRQLPWDVAPGGGSIERISPLTISAPQPTSW